MNRFFRFGLVAAAAAMCISAASAADLVPIKPAKTPRAFSGYPYAASGFYYGLYTSGGGGAIKGNIAGVNPNSLVSTQASVGGTLGYVWARADSPVFYAVEAQFGWQNFNGNSQGLSLSGPAAFAQRFKIGTPLASLLSAFPDFGLPSVPPFPALPSGEVAQNIHPYLMVGLHEDDISVAYLLDKRKEWSIAPSIGIGAMGQLSNGVAVDVWVETVFPESGACVGPFACAGIGQQVKVGFGLYY